MGYRVDLAQDCDRDLPLAAALQEKRIAWNRKQAAPALALPADAHLDAKQRNCIRSLGASMFALGQILMVRGDRGCIAEYEETVQHMKRIQDTTAEAIAHYNIGHTYMQISAIRDLDAAEAAYQQSLALHDPNNTLGRSKCTKQIGMVHHGRFKESRQRGEPVSGGEIGGHFRGETGATKSGARRTGSRSGTGICGRCARSQGSSLQGASAAKVAPFLTATDTSQRKLC